ncbi:hypothetical protein H6F42_03255 [Pseudanabaena sp. FACHB-1998]|nr:hypothetical protein [Pseudanabaena sp. FACHB-1998]MBD2175936.1 hypothetical protein [Pseudanabaena sp. FACHB-1998]
MTTLLGIQNQTHLAWIVDKAQTPERVAACVATLSGVLNIEKQELASTN